MRTVGLVAVLALATGCAGIPPGNRPIPWSAYRAVHRGIENDDRMVEVVRTLVPDGTSVSDVPILMGAAGFRCTSREQATVRAKDIKEEDLWFPDESDPKASSAPLPVDQTGMSYLYCYRDDRAGFGVNRLWKVRLGFREDKIAEVQAEHKFVGL